MRFVNEPLEETRTAFRPDLDQLLTLRCYNRVGWLSDEPGSDMDQEIKKSGLETPQGTLIIEDRCTSQRLKTLGMAADLGIFWHARLGLQHEALIKIAELGQGHVVIAVHDEVTIVGYIAMHPPADFSRWGPLHLGDLIELGGIEVSRNWRRCGVARHLLQALLDTGAYEDKIVIAEALRWCWDLDETGLSVTQYRQMLLHLFGQFGFERYLTDDPEIADFPGNALAARIGPRARPESIAWFKNALFLTEPVKSI